MIPFHLTIHKMQLRTMFFQDLTSAYESASSSSSSCSSDLQSSRSSSTDLFWTQDMLDDRSSTYSISTQPYEEITEDWASTYSSDSWTSSATSINRPPPPSRCSTPDVDWILEVIGEPAPSRALPDDYSDLWWKYGDTFERCGEVAGKRNFDGNNFLEREGLWRVS